MHETTKICAAGLNAICTCLDRIVEITPSWVAWKPGSGSAAEDGYSSYKVQLPYGRLGLVQRAGSAPGSDGGAERSVAAEVVSPRFSGAQPMLPARAVRLTGARTRPSGSHDRVARQAMACWRRMSRRRASTWFESCRSPMRARRPPPMCWTRPLPLTSGRCPRVWELLAQRGRCGGSPH